MAGMCVYGFAWVSGSNSLCGLGSSLLKSEKARDGTRSTTKPHSEQVSHSTVTSSGGHGEGMSEKERRGQTMTTKEKHHVE